MTGEVSGRGEMYSKLEVQEKNVRSRLELTQYLWSHQGEPAEERGGSCV